MNHFTYTRKGYQVAKKYLINTFGIPESYFKDKDGYSIIAEANYRFINSLKP